MDYSIYIDIAIIGIIVLFAIIGLWKGFFKSLISFFGIIVSLIISIYFASTVAAWLLPHWPARSLFGDGGWLPSKINSWLMGINGTVFGSAYGDNPDALSSALSTELKIPAIISGIIVKVAGQMQFLSSDITLAQIIADSISGSLYWLLIATILFVILRVILFLLGKLFDFLTKNKTISGLNRLFGFIIGAVKGTLFVALAFAVMSFFMGLAFMSDFNAKLQNTTIGKPFSDTVFKFVGENVDLDKIIGDILGKKALTEEEQAVYDALEIDLKAYTQDKVAEINENISTDYSTLLQTNENIRTAILTQPKDITAEEWATLKTHADTVRTEYENLFLTFDEYFTKTTNGEDTTAEIANIESKMREIYNLYKDNFGKLVSFEA